jgi:ribose 5-phosphate isomerase B
MKIVIASDHAGFELKQYIKEELNNSIDIKDVGCHSEKSVDYPDFAHLAAKEINNDNVEFGIFICGSGNGIQMTANKHQKIRCALCWTKEIAILSRSHNDANAIAIPARFLKKEEAIEIINSFITTSFEGGRHRKRKDKISCV